MNIALCVTAFVLRVTFVLWKKMYVQHAGYPYPFAMEVSSIATHLARGQGFSSPFIQNTGPTAWVAPIYPFLVSLVFRAFGIYSAASAFIILILQCAVAAATAVAIYALGKRTLGEEVGLWAAWIWAVSPFFFRWPVSWIWDFAASALLLATLLILTVDIGEHGRRKNWMLWSGLWGITALTNPALLSVLPFTFIFAIVRNNRDGRRWIAHSAISVLLFIAIISPWAIRNDLVFGHPVFLRSNFWFEFHLGNYHYSNGMGYSGYHPGTNPREFKRYAEMGEQGYIQQAKKDALGFVRNYPREFLDLTLHRVLWFWDGTSIHYQAFEWWKQWEYWPLSVTAWLGFIFLLTRRPRGWSLYVGCLVVYPAPYYLVYVVPKYRHAIEPEMLLLSVYLVAVLWSEASLFRDSRAKRSHSQNIKLAQSLPHE